MHGVCWLANCPVGQSSSTLKSLPSPSLLNIPILLLSCCLQWYILPWLLTPDNCPPPCKRPENWFDCRHSLKVQFRWYLAWQWCGGSGRQYQCKLKKFVSGLSCLYSLFKSGVAFLRYGAVVAVYRTNIRQINDYIFLLYKAISRTISW